MLSQLRQFIKSPLKETRGYLASLSDGGVSDRANKLWFRLLYGGVSQDDKTEVTDQGVLGLTAAFAAVRILSESVGQLPLKIYRRLPDGTKEEVTDTPFADLFDVPNPRQCINELIEMMVGHLCMRGNFFAYKRPRGDGFYTLEPLNPSNMSVMISPQTRELIYRYTEDDMTGGTPARAGQQIILLADEVLHIKGITFDGILGVNPITASNRALALGISAQEYAVNFFDNAAIPAAILTHPGEIKTPEGIAQIKKDFKSAYGGPRNAGEIAVLQEGADFKNVSLTHKDAQFVEQRRALIHDVARIFRVPVHMLSELERATFNNTEQLGAEFVRYSLSPWLTRIEKAIDTQLLRPRRAVYGDLYAKFNAAALLKAETKTRFETHAIGIQNGIISRNEARALEDLPPYDGGDEMMISVQGKPQGAPVDSATDNDDNANQAPPPRVDNEDGDKADE